MNESFLYDAVETGVGPLTVVVDRKGSLVELWLSDVCARLAQDGRYSRDSGAIAEAARQLSEYCEGKRRDFELPLAPAGSDFQKRVWEQLLLIPYGETRSYGQIAAQLGLLNGARAVGRANATNPIGIVIPCHRVVGSSGDLTGYGGGLPMKQRLLKLEGALKTGLFDL